MVRVLAIVGAYMAYMYRIASRFDTDAMRTGALERVVFVSVESPPRLREDHHRPAPKPRSLPQPRGAAGLPLPRKGTLP